MILKNVLFKGIFENVPDFTKDRNLQNQEAELLSNIRSTTDNLDFLIHITAQFYILAVYQQCFLRT